MKKLFITGIGTDIGKTVASAIVVEALQADYWKPIQSGDLDFSDTMKVQSMISNSTTKFHPEAYTFQNPLSPHAAAALEHIRIDLNKIHVPSTQNTLVIEGAGGLLVPLNEDQYIVDLIEQTEAEVLLVSRNYLGSINHTLLTFEMLRSRNIKIKGLIFNGVETNSSESIIQKHTNLPVLLHIHQEQTINKSVILSYAHSFLTNYNGCSE